MTPMPKLLIRLLLGLLLAAFAFHAATRAADNPPVAMSGDGLAIQGYDPVAYFTDGKAVPGDPAHSFDWQGATWLFASAAHRDAFTADPLRYAPQYGGYCAYAISKGHAAPASPEVWSIVEDKLYLNLGAGVQSLWQEDVTGNIARATSNWPGALVDPGRRPAAPATATDR